MIGGVAQCLLELKLNYEADEIPATFDSVGHKLYTIQQTVVLYPAVLSVRDELLPLKNAGYHLFEACKRLSMRLHQIKV